MDMASTTNGGVEKVGNINDGDYRTYVDSLTYRFLNNDARPLFTTDADGEKLWAAYLDTFTDPEQRQFHNCNSCRRFIENFGGLVFIDVHGHLTPAVWNLYETPTELYDAVTAMIRIINKAKVTGVFLSSEPILGTPVTGKWRHVGIVQTNYRVWKSKTETAFQRMAVIKGQYTNVQRALNEFSPKLIADALAIINSEALQRSEKVLGPVQWLAVLHEKRNATIMRSKRDNMTWLAVAQAPDGFCYPRSSMAGSLLEDLESGMSLAEVKRRFDAKMRPTRYQRPQAPPSAGTVAQAEKLVAQMGIAKSLERRFATMEDIAPYLAWSPKLVDNPTNDGSVFGHLLNPTKESERLMPGAMTISWSKFERTVLLNAESMAILAPTVGSYTALVTAVHADAPPILQWDVEEVRNPVSWYLWTSGASASQFGLHGNRYHEVETIVPKPTMWNSRTDSHHEPGMVFVIKGAQESRCHGNALFPEILKSELHGVRSVIEAYSKTATIQGMEQPHVAGLMFTNTNNVTVRVKVQGTTVVTTYKIDRWD